MGEETSNDGVLALEPPDELRCRRSDGKLWRCCHWRIHNQGFCEHHYLEYKRKAMKARGSAGSSKGGSFSGKRRKNVKPQKGLKVGSAARKPKFDESEEEEEEEKEEEDEEEDEEEEEELIPLKKDRSGNAKAKSSSNGRGSVVSKLVKKRFLVNRKSGKAKKRGREDVKVEEEEEEEEESVPKKKSKLDNNLVSRGRESNEKEFSKKKDKVKVEESEEEDEGKENKGDSEVVLADRKTRSREKIKRLFQEELEQDNKRSRKSGSKTGLADGRSKSRSHMASDVSFCFSYQA